MRHLIVLLGYVLLVLLVFRLAAAQDVPPQDQGPELILCNAGYRQCAAELVDDQELQNCCIDLVNDIAQDIEGFPFIDHVALSFTQLQIRGLSQPTLELCTAHTQACRDSIAAFSIARKACLDTIDLAESLAAQPAAVPVECTPIQGNELWKPKAETNIGAVILVNDSLQGVPVSVTDINGAVVANEIRQVCCPNGGREHRFFDVRGDAMPSSVLVRFGDARCIRIDNPGIRNG